MNLPILIFDWDGVIADSINYKYKGIWEDVFPDDAEKHKSIADFIKTDEGKLVNRYGLIRHALIESGEDSLRGIDGVRLKNHPLVYQYAERYNKAAIEGVAKIGMFSDTEKTLRELNKKGYKMYVISGGGTDADLEELANRFGVRDYFIKLFGFGDPKMPLVTFGKYANFERIVKIEGDKNPEQYIVIGDGESDRILAKEIGCPFIGIAREWNRWQESEDHKVVSQTADIIKFL